MNVTLRRRHINAITQMLATEHAQHLVPQIANIFQAANPSFNAALFAAEVQRLQERNQNVRSV